MVAIFFPGGDELGPSARSFPLPVPVIPMPSIGLAGRWDTSITGLILGLFQANERRRYFVTTSFIGWAQESALYSNDNNGQITRFQCK